MTEKERFVHLALSGKFAISELCDQHGISRKTGHKYINRYKAQGRDGLVERSRRPKTYANASDADIIRLILLEKRKHPNWGGKKIRQLLKTVHGIENLPHVNTVNNVLQRHGLVKKRKKRRPGVYRVHPEHLTEPTRPNEVWTVDFKGYFLVGDGTRCDPLTVCDRFSRYVLCCKAQPNQQYGHTLYTFKKFMRHYGLPEIIRVDNGPPFASYSMSGLSKLSVWWILQGIQVEYIRPASPQENGSHERMHRDLKADTAKKPSPNLRAQQKRFDRWRKEYNHLRPHEALDMLCPVDFYHTSSRRLGEQDKIAYPCDYTVRPVGESGHISYLGDHIYVGHIFHGALVGLRENSAGVTELYFANWHLGNLEYNPGDPLVHKPEVIWPNATPRQAFQIKRKRRK